MTLSMTRLIQIAKGNDRAVALVEEPGLRLLHQTASIYSLAQEAIANGLKLSALVKQKLSNLVLDYDPIYTSQSDWRILPPIDHPREPSRCLVSGTGLTHLGSARDRQDMHAIASEDLTDSMKMFRWGIAGGRPAAGEIGTPQSGFTKVPEQSCALTMNPSKFRPTPKTAAKKPKSREFTSSIPTAAHIASAWRPATSFPIMSSRKRTT